LTCGEPRSNIAHHAYCASSNDVASGDKQARSAYQDFFALWKDADQDITILKKAKAPSCSKSKRQ